ncbi:hypothetical protein RchiOBHm_Chr4g0386541 [Rosa chinensis]|uniref:Uncharacterized protein n=1 Tax=Rosa chinensis TaxID=74649 RepID=A0A2P6QP74_ROSCH|nr:hypothetical protein RchiOBHm_Chr4g0386541 [Rosa chinensis]
MVFMVFAYQVEFESLAVELDGKNEWLLKEKVEAKLEAILKATQEGPSQQNRNLEKMINAHVTTSQSQQSSRPINAPSNDLENRRCALLNWNNYEEDEVVAEGKISSTNPSTKVHCVPLGRDC